MVEFAPERLTQLVGAWASSAQDCNRLFQRKGRAIKYRQPIDQFAQAAIVEPQRIRTPIRHVPARQRGKRRRLAQTDR